MLSTNLTTSSLPVVLNPTPSVLRQLKETVQSKAEGFLGVQKELKKKWLLSEWKGRGIVSSRGALSKKRRMPPQIMSTNRRRSGSEAAMLTYVEQREPRVTYPYTHTVGLQMKPSIE
jgi:hypothetical protein